MKETPRDMVASCLLARALERWFARATDRITAKVTICSVANPTLSSFVSFLAARVSF